MDYIKVYELVKGNNSKKFIITDINGNKTTKRLFISVRDNICEFAPRSRTKGYILNIDNIIDINMCVSNKTDIDYFRRNLSNVIKYLSNSGLWQPMLQGAKYLSSLSDDEIKTLKDYQIYNNYNKENNIRFWNYDCFLSLFSKGAIKTINLHKYQKEDILRDIRHAITHKINYKHQWQKGYDNSIELSFNNDIAYGWYSEEYRGCGNGHYYFLLDDVHALFCEDD